MDAIPLQTLITVGGIIFAALGAWYTVKGSVKSLTERMESITKQVSDLWAKKDGAVEDVAELKHDVRYLRRDVDELRELAKEK